MSATADEVEGLAEEDKAESRTCQPTLVPQFDTVTRCISYYGSGSSVNHVPNSASVTLAVEQCSISLHILLPVSNLASLLSNAPCIAPTS